jgi:hypothetical protein
MSIRLCSACSNDGHGGARGLHFGLVAFRLDDFDDALDPEQAIDTRRNSIGTRGNLGGNLQDRRQHVFVDRTMEAAPVRLTVRLA